jgi:hypothetical protein
MVVDFPEPFGPRNPVTIPGWTTKFNPSTASLVPYRLLRFSTSIMVIAFQALVGDMPRPSMQQANGWRASGAPVGFRSEVKAWVTDWTWSPEIAFSGRHCCVGTGSDETCC